MRFSKVKKVTGGGVNIAIEATGVGFNEVRLYGEIGCVALFGRMINEETHSPTECPEVYNRLIFDKNFPVVVQFDWRDK